MLGGPESRKSLCLGPKRNKMPDLETKGQGHEQLKAEPEPKDGVEIGLGGVGGQKQAPWNEKRMGMEHGHTGEVPG